MKNKTIISMFVMILISLSFVNGAASGSCDVSPTAAISDGDIDQILEDMYLAEIGGSDQNLLEQFDQITVVQLTLSEQLQLQKNVVNSRAVERDAIAEAIKNKEQAIEDLKTKKAEATTVTDLTKAKADISAAESELATQKEELVAAQKEVEKQALEASKLRAKILDEKMSTFAGSLDEYNKAYNSISGVTNFYLDKWDKMQQWRAPIDEFFARNNLGIEPIISRLCDLWTIGTDSTSNMAFGEDGAASAHVEGILVETREDPIDGDPEIVMSYRVTFSVTRSVLTKSSDEVTVRVKLYNGASGTEIGSYKLGDGVSQIGAQGAGTLVQTGGVYDTVCLSFAEEWRYKGDFRQYLKSCKDGGDRCLCNKFGSTGSSLPGFATGTTEAFSNALLG